MKEQFDENAFKKRINESLEWKNDKYAFVYPKTVQDIKDEATRQNNCVASYVDKVIDGHCHILFMRNKDNIDHSLVTIEVRDNLVVQAKGKFNRDVNSEEELIIEKYNKYLNKQTNVDSKHMEVLVC